MGLEGLVDALVIITLPGEIRGGDGKRKSIGWLVIVLGWKNTGFESTYVFVLNKRTSRIYDPPRFKRLQSNS